METIEKYNQMFDIFVRCTDSLKGRIFSEECFWQMDAENLAKKLFFHLGSVFKLQHGTTIHNIADLTFDYVDFPSISVLTRSAFETFLCYHFIYIQPEHLNEKKFRHDVWKLGGMLDRQRCLVFSQEGKAKLHEEKIICEQLKHQVETNPIYNNLTDARKKDAKKGKWRLGMQWADIAENTGVHKQYFISVYAYLSAYAHSGHLGILQLSKCNGYDNQAKLAKIYLHINLTLMSHFLISYCSFFEEAQSFMDSHEDYKRFVDTYYFTADDWENYIKNA